MLQEGSFMKLATRPERTIVLAAAAAILFHAGIGKAQSPAAPPATPLSLEECVDTALRNNPGLAISQAQLRATEGNRESSYSNLLPSATVQTSFNRNSFWSVSPIPRINPNDATVFYPAGRSRVNSWTLAANVNQSLIAPSNWYRFDAAASNVVAARQALRASRAETVYQVSQAYFLLVRGILLEQVAKDALRVANSQLDRSKAMFDVGSVARSDVLQASVNAATAERDEINARSAIEQERALLAALMGIDVQKPLEIRTDVTESENTEYDEPKLMGEALEIRPEVLHSRAQLRAAQKLHRSAFWDLWPTIGGSLFYEKQDASFSRISNLGDLTNEQASWGLSIGLNWNIFDGLGRLGSLKTATANETIARESVRQAELDAAVGIREALVATRNAREGIVAAEQGVGLAEENLRLQQALYENGGGTILDLNTAQVALTRARTDLVDARISLHLAIAQLKRAVGAER
jgi:outer membrane protein